MNINPQNIQLQISNLLLQHPELMEDEDFRADMIEGCTNAPEFLSLLVRRIGETNALAEGTSLYIQELAARKNRLSARVEGMRTLIQKVMDVAQLQKLELSEATLSIRNGTPKVILTDETALPDDCVKVIRSPDKAEIKLRLAAGQTVPGAVLSNPEPSLTIRTR